MKKLLIVIATFIVVGAISFLVILGVKKAADSQLGGVTPDRRDAMSFFNEVTGESQVETEE